MSAIFTVSPSPVLTQNAVVTVTLKDASFTDNGSTTITAGKQGDTNNKITLSLKWDGVQGSQTYKGQFTLQDAQAGATTSNTNSVLALNPNDTAVLSYTDGATTPVTTTSNVVYAFNPSAATSLDTTPTVAWGVDKQILIRVKDSTQAITANPTATVLENLSNPANTIQVPLSYDASFGGFVGSFYLTNNPASTLTPKLVVTHDNRQINVSYSDKIETIAYTQNAPAENGNYVEVRSSVRNLHWDLVTILCKAGWKFVETIAPTVDANGYVTDFKHVLRTTTTPQLVDGQPMSVDMFLLIEHKQYPGNNQGNYKTITFKLAPNYYYHDPVALGNSPDTTVCDILFQNTATSVFKVLEFPTYPVDLMYLPMNTQGVIPFVLDIPVNIWGYASNDFFSLIFQGEPSLTTDGFGQVSHVYGGQINSFKEGKTDIGGNFALAGSAFIGTPGGMRYGANTSDGVNSVAMYRTYGGLMWQKHYASVIHDDPQGDSHKSELYQPSSWTGKFHLSPVYVYHPTDGKRGFMKNTLIVQKQGVLHLDEFEVIRPANECNPCPTDPAGHQIDPNDVENPNYATAWVRDKYKFYRLTNLQHFLKSFNVNGQTTGIGLAIKMETDNSKIIKFNTSYDIVTGQGISSFTGVGTIPEGAQYGSARTAPISSGKVTLATGAANEVPVPNNVTGMVSNFDVVRDGDTNAPLAALVEVTINQNPNGATEFTMIASDKVSSTSVTNSVAFQMYRAYDLDASGKYGFRGQFYMAQVPGGTSNSSSVLEGYTGDNLTVTYQSITKTITL